MKITNKVKIGGVTFKVEYKRNLTVGTGAYGQLHPSRQKIIIDKNLEREMQEGSFIHEIIEAINGMYELDLEHWKISVLDAALYQIIKDNPGIFSENLEERTGNRNEKETN
jgi:hypothetical protein